MAARGSECESLKADIDEVSVRMDIGGESYTRRLTCKGDTVAFDSDSCPDDPPLRIYAFILRSKEIRQRIEF
jgi:hypothetical protein